MLVPLKLTTHKLEQTLGKVDDLVTKIELIDFFEKEEWLDKRSLAFRLWLNHPEKTLEKEEIEVPKPRRESKEPRILVVKTKDIPKMEIREAELEGNPVTVETIHEAITEMRNDLKEIKKSLTG